MFNWKVLIFILFIGCTHLYSQEDISPTSTSFNFKWENGFKLKREDGLFSLNFGGYFFIDHAYLQQNSELSDHYGLLDVKSRTEIRSARLYFSGNVYGNTNFKFQVDFAGDKVVLKDVYIGISDIPVIGNFRIGHFKEPFRLSALTSSRNLIFMEPSSNIYFAQSRNHGAMLFNDFLNKQLSVQIGAFRNANNNRNYALEEDGYVVDGRVTGIPLRNNDKKQLLHLGAAYSYRNPSSREYKVSLSPGSHLAEKYVSNLIDSVEKIDLVNFETAYVHGPFSIQAEYLNASITTLGNHLNFSNYYAELSYFLTGESRNYQGSYEGFGRITPKKNFGSTQNGSGAWEIALKYSKTDLDDGIIIPGKESQWAAGINWYLNPVTRVMVNYVRANIEDKGSLNVVQARFQLEF
ncbi:hypothetical protein EI546_11140 [Aequorivita sp. H23M31]|uniref:Porin n=1 Tax=Aequorivita ciconiae TaxID=2494375 RepID=A0A410G4R8_9FLAO|nr:porin [Aequorivita sp. H23M31]QAA82239.1 hypothetical protein EI546_11140 [Aequorivita sp. H23M31]